ncbi:WD repeat-containing protein 76 isoform X1 [Rhipicephalus sanguineus]|uniref:WD repeat-containing protein 76 isoform X1 n=1 Tax=Rhipicephalus sanguineus TaxID=34632 RepID=UPI001892D5F1|nr:WD repeat-containing protein 76 isoform X1 [Rhipicephalus sanguineus]
MTTVTTFYGASTRISARLTLKRLRKAEAEAEESTTTKPPERDDKVHSAKKKKKQRADENEAGGEPTVKQEKEESYRSVIQKNIAEKMAFLESLGVDELKVSLAPPPVHMPAKSPRSAKKPKQEVEHVGARKSLRLQNKPAVAENLGSFYQEPVKERIKPGPLAFKEVAGSGVDEGGRSCLCEDIVKEELSQVALESLSREAEEFLDRMMDVNVDDMVVQKVVSARITAMAVHPSLTATLVFAGDKLGNFGFLKVGTGENVVETYTPHDSGLMCLRIRPEEPQKIYSASYDDTLRCADIERGIFDELYRTDPDVGVMYVDWLLDNTMIAAHGNGQVSFLDPRSQEKKTGIYQLHNRKVRTINAHPTNSWWFLTGSTDTMVKLWDSRMMSKRSPVPLGALTHNRSCSAAFLSPVEGNKVLSTSFDDTLRICNINQATGDMKQQITLKHNNMTGRWLSPFRAVWVPGCDELFLVGSMEYPRRIEVYSSSGSLLYKFTGESLASVCSIVEVHPERLVIAGGNSSGKLHVLIEP